MINGHGNAHASRPRKAEKQKKRKFAVRKNWQLIKSLPYSNPPGTPGGVCMENVLDFFLYVKLVSIDLV